MTNPRALWLSVAVIGLACTFVCVLAARWQEAVIGIGVLGGAVVCLWIYEVGR